MLELAAVQCKHRELRVDRVNNSCKSCSQLGVFRSAVIKRSMRLHVRQARSVHRACLLECENLLTHTLHQLVEGHLDFSATETLTVGIRRMSSDRDATFQRRSYRHFHYQRGARMD